MNSFISHWSVYVIHYFFNLPMRDQFAKCNPKICLKYLYFLRGTCAKRVHNAFHIEYCLPSCVLRQEMHSIVHKLINIWCKNNAKFTKIALFKQPEITRTCSKTLSECQISPSSLLLVPSIFQMEQIYK